MSIEMGTFQVVAGGGYQQTISNWAGATLGRSAHTCTTKRYEIREPTVTFLCLYLLYL